jgi:hypothetical protein
LYYKRFVNKVVYQLKVKNFSVVVFSHIDIDIPTIGDPDVIESRYAVADADQGKLRFCLGRSAHSVSFSKDSFAIFTL